MYNFVAPFLFSVPHVLHIFFSSFLSTCFNPFLFLFLPTFTPSDMPHHNCVWGTLPLWLWCVLWYPRTLPLPLFSGIWCIFQAHELLLLEMFMGVWHELSRFKKSLLSRHPMPVQRPMLTSSWGHHERPPIKHNCISQKDIAQLSNSFGSSICPRIQWLSHRWHILHRMNIPLVPEFKNHAPSSPIQRTLMHTLLSYESIHGMIHWHSKSSSYAFI